MVLFRHVYSIAGVAGRGVWGTTKKGRNDYDMTERETLALFIEIPD